MIGVLEFPHTWRSKYTLGTLGGDNLGPSHLPNVSNLAVGTLVRVSNSVRGVSKSLLYQLLGSLLELNTGVADLLSKILPLYKLGALLMGFFAGFIASIVNPFHVLLVHSLGRLLDLTMFLWDP
jgi:hypothetical protein